VTSASWPTGPFVCEVELRRIRAPEFVREEKQGVTYLVARDYETAYATTLRFPGGAQLTIKAKVVGELNQRLSYAKRTGGPYGRAGMCKGSCRSTTPTDA
jgi:hypothetical protein